MTKFIELSNRFNSSGKSRTHQKQNVQRLADRTGKIHAKE